MANMSLRSVILYDKWPGVVNPNMSVPVNGFDSTKEGSGNCVSESIFQIGLKIQAYNDGTYNPGFYTMQYLQFCEGSSNAYDVGDLTTGYRACFWYDVTQHHPDGNNAGTWYVVTNNVSDSDATRGGGVAFPVCDLSGAETTGSNAPEFGWFWVGGVNPCVTSPVADCTKLGGAGILSDGDIVKGTEFTFEADGTACARVIPYCFTAIFEVTLGYDATQFYSPAGKSLADDA